MHNNYASLLLTKDELLFLDSVKKQSSEKNSAISVSKTESIYLVPSEKCNLKCSYCYERNKNPVPMDMDIAKRSISNLFKRVTKDTLIKIEYRGGEPFLEFDFIKEISEWVMNNYGSYFFCFSAVTNGTCFTHESKEWLITHKNIFNVPLSIDGNRESHNTNRSNSFDNIDFDFILSNWKYPSSFTTFLPKNANNIYEDLLFLIQKGFSLRVNFEVITEWNDSELATLANQLKKLVDYLIATDTEYHMNLLSSAAIHDYTVDCNEDRRFIQMCNAGKTRRIYDAKGNCYPCHTMVPSVFKGYSKSESINLFDKLKSEVLNPPECCKCNFFYLCYICPGFSYSYAHDFKYRNWSFCDITKIRTFMSAYYWGKLLTKKGKVITDKDKGIAYDILKLYKGENIGQ